MKIIHFKHIYIITLLYGNCKVDSSTTLFRMNIMLMYYTYLYMLLLFQKKKERTDLKYSPVKEQEDENVTTLTTLTRWPFILESGTMMWSNMSVFLQALRMLINPPDRPFFHKLRFRLHQQQPRTLLIHSNGHTSATWLSFSRTKIW